MLGTRPPAQSSPSSVETLPCLGQRYTGALQPGEHIVQGSEVFPTFNLKENLGLPDELRLAGDAKGELFQTANAGGKCSCVHAG